MFDLTPFSNRRLSVYDPFAELEDWPRAWFGGSQPWQGFRTDIREEDDRYILEADLPGCSRQDVEVTVENDRLTINAQRRQEGESRDQGGYLRRERAWGSFSRSFDLSRVDADQITAAYNDGVLTLTLPKKEEQRPAARKLEIR